MADRSDYGGPYPWTPFVPVLYVTPNLGWPNRDSMFKAKNPRLASFLLLELEVVTEAAAYYKNPDSLIFEYHGTSYRISPGDLHELGVGLHYWRVNDEEIDSFVLMRGPISPKIVAPSVLPTHNPKVI